MSVAKIWRNRIIAGTKTYDECPAKYKGMVLEFLRADVAAGIITAEKFKELTGEDY